jgi:hypothetical protein
MPPSEPIAERVVDRIPSVDGAVAVGEDLDFQRRWWRFEKAAWLLLAVVLIADALGAFGRGWLAQAELTAADGSMRVRYERVERTGTPSEMTIEFGPSAVRDQKVRMFASQTTVKELGAQRVIPQPIASEIGPGGVTYTFSAAGSPATASIAMQPSFPGVHHIELRVLGSDPVRATIVILP